MKVQAIILSKGVAEIGEINVDSPSGDEVLIETRACGICMGDVYAFQGKLPGGRAMGHEGVGIVAEVGEKVENVNCGEKVTTLGGPAFAQLYKTSCRNVAKVPDDVEDLACWISEPLACVVNGIRGSEIQIGDSVGVIGCGYMGVLLIQAMPKGIMSNLIAVDIRNEPLNLARRFGAGFAFNSKEVNVVTEVFDVLNGRADVVIEASGAPGTLYLATEMVRDGGKLVIFGRHVIDERVPTEKWHTKGLRVLNIAPAFSANFNEDFHDSVKLLRKGIFDQRPLITHRFSYRDAETAFKVASEKTAGYIKGVITF